MTAFDEELRKLGGGFLPVPPQVEFLYRIIVDCEPPIEVGIADGELKRIFPIVGGRFVGPRMKGSVLPVGADWNTARRDDVGCRKVDTRYILKTDDEAVISLSTLGFSRRSSEVVAMRESGERVNPELYYFKQHLFLETGHEDYEWLNSLVAFGSVMSKYQGGPGVIYDAYYLA